jgi:hypothetical protein
MTRVTPTGRAAQSQKHAVWPSPSLSHCPPLTCVFHAQAESRQLQDRMADQLAVTLDKVEAKHKPQVGPAVLGSGP